MIDDKIYADIVETLTIAFEVDENTTLKELAQKFVDRRDSRFELTERFFANIGIIVFAIAEKQELVRPIYQIIDEYGTKIALVDNLDEAMSIVKDNQDVLKWGWEKIDGS